MLSTLLNYRSYTTNLTKTLERVQQSATVAADTKYYQENIGKVDSVDEFLDDYRLYTYALKAYGLEDQVSSKGFVRKVVESDLSDSRSFANALSDSRYRDFAEAFNFSSPAAASAVASPQSARQSEAIVEAYSEHRIRQGSVAATKTSYFKTTIATVRSVDEFLNNSVLFDVALRSIGADPALTSKSYVRDVLTGALADDSTTATDDKFFQLADAFAFSADGTVAEGVPALGTDETSALIYGYNKATGNNASAPAAAHNSEYYAQQIGLIDDVDDLVNDPRLFEYILTSYGLLEASIPASISNILTSDPSDPKSPINNLTEGTTANYRDRLFALNAAFNFESTGAVPTGEAAQSETEKDAAIDAYHDKYEVNATAADDKRTSTFEFLMGRVKTVSDLLRKDKDFDLDLYEYVLTAFDLDPSAESVTRIRRVLQSDTSDPKSYVNRLGDERYVKLAAAFNFDANGKSRPERLVQSSGDQTATGTRYSASFGSDLSKVKKDLVTAETRQYIEAIADIRTLDEFLAADSVVSYALTAYGLDDEDLTTDELRKLFTSDLADPASYANERRDPRYIEFISAFNFGSDGLVSTDGGGFQTGADLYTTQNLFLMTSLEQQAGETSEGARLALYFLRKAPEAATTLELLADRALVEVVRTAFSLPAEMSQLDLDKQVAIIEKRLDVEDFKDPKKLDNLIARFAALYDLQNADLTLSSPALALFSQSGSSEGGLLALL